MLYQFFPEIACKMENKINTLIESISKQLYNVNQIKRQLQLYVNQMFIYYRDSYMSIHFQYTQQNSVQGTRMNGKQDHLNSTVEKIIPMPVFQTTKLLS